MGIMIIGPVSKTMNEFSDNSQMNVKIWMSIHEVSHIFLEGGDVMVAKGILTQEQIDEIRLVSECLDESKISSTKTNDVTSLFSRASKYY